MSTDIQADIDFVRDLTGTPDADVAAGYYPALERVLDYAEAAAKRDRA